MFPIVTHWPCALIPPSSHRILAAAARALAHIDPVTARADLAPLVAQLTKALLRKRSSALHPSSLTHLPATFVGLILIFALLTECTRLCSFRALAEGEVVALSAIACARLQATPSDGL